jgi:TolA-binding protein
MRSFCPIRHVRGLHVPVVALWLSSMLAALSAFAADVPAPAQRKATPQDNARAEAAAAAEAEKARKIRESRVPTIVAEQAREKVETSASPTLEFDDYRRKTEVKVASKRLGLIRKLDEILAQDPGEEEVPELLFQKGELFLEEARYWFFEANRVDDAIAAALSRGDDAEMTAASEKKDQLLQKQMKWSDDAIRVFESIEKKYKKFDRVADVVYMIGQAYWDRAEYKKGLSAFRRIIKDYARSQYIADAWLAFGEYYFQISPDDERDVSKALDAYVKAAANQDSPVFGYAVYKQGWCYYNLGRHDKAAEKFKEVVLYSQVNGALLGEKKVGLAKEARKDYVLAFAQYGTAAEAPGEFQTIAEGDEFRFMLDRLADIYYGDGKDRDAIIIYQNLIKTNPEGTRNPLYQGKIVKLASRIGEKKQVVGQARRLLEEYKRVRRIAESVPTGDGRRKQIDADLLDADDIADNTLRFLSTTWHNEAKKTLDSSTFEYAYELYGDYLELFPGRKEAYEMRFFYAELLFKLEKFDLAGEQYIRVFQTDPRGKWAEPAAEEAVRSYEEVVKDFDRVAKTSSAASAPTDNLAKERPIPEAKKKYIAACNNYIKNFPDGKLIVEAMYKVAKTLYDYNYFSESTSRFIEFTEKYPDHPRAEQAANLVLDSYNIVEDWTGLNAAVRRFSKNASLVKSKDFAAMVARVKEESTFKVINDFEKKRQWEEAAKRYVAFADEFPKGALADKALANAAAMYTRSGDLDRAIKARLRLVNEYRDSPLVPDQFYAIAIGFEQIVAYKEAATWLERFVAEHPQDPRAKDALFNASIYRQGTNDTKKAVEDRDLYLKMFPEAPDAEDVAFSVASAWEESGNTKAAVKAYSDFAVAWRRKSPARALNAQYRAYRILEASKAAKTELERAFKDLDTEVKAYQRAGKPLDGAAEPVALIVFRDADVVLEDYKEVRITKADNPVEFKKTLQQKRDAKDLVKKAYTEVVKLKSPEWAVASLFRIGEAEANLAKVIKEVPPPRAFTAEQAQLFKDKLEEMSLPIEDEAAQTMALCLEKSSELAVFNEWTRRCLSYLEESRPNQYPKDGLDARAPVSARYQPAEQGRGLVLSLPKAGERLRTEPGTEPPPSPKDVKSSSGLKQAPTLELSIGDVGGGS